MNTTLVSVDRESTRPPLREQRAAVRELRAEGGVVWGDEDDEAEEVTWWTGRIGAVTAAAQK